MSKSESQQEQIFLDILKQNKKIIYKICYSYCKDPDDRKDLEQEVIIQLWNALPDYKSEFKLSTWIYKITLNTAISHLRKESRKITETYLFDEQITETLHEHQNEVYDDRIELLYKFIDGLGKLEKALMILYLDDNSYKEISEILGITETNVATKISRIKQSLKIYFSKLEN